MEKILTEELLKQLRLMQYDRSKTIIEQITTPNKRNVKNLTLNNPDLNPENSTTDKESNEIFNELKSALNYKKILSSLRNVDEGEVLSIVKKINKENYMPILFMVLKIGYNSIMDFIMTGFNPPSEWSEEYYGDEDKFSLTQLGGVEKYTNYYNNDVYVFKISEHLRKFKNINDSEGEYSVRYSEVQDLAMDSPGARMGTDEELAEIAHIMLPIISVILTLGASSWLMVWLAFGVEVGDAAIYQFINEDPYMAGLALIFAFTGPTDKFLSPLIKKYGKSILVKLGKKQALNDGEMATIRYINANKGKLFSLTIFKIIKKYIKEFITRTKGVKVVLGFIIWLVNKGYIVSKFLTHMGLIVGGSFYTWDKIASVLGLCNSVKLEPLKESDYKILKLIGTTGPYIQPFTKGCEIEEGKKIFSDEEKKLMNTRIILMMDEVINNNLVLSTKYSQYKMVETILLQNVLKYFGFSYFVPDEKKVTKSVESGTKWSKEKCLSQFTMSIDMYKLSKHPECQEYLKPNKNISKETEKVLSGKPLNNSNYKMDYGIKKDFKWGYYDKQTENMVREFQKKYGLTVDGVAGENTFKKIKELVEKLGDKTIPDYTGFSWSPKEIENLRKKMIDKLKSIQEQNQIDVSEEQIQESFENQKNKIVEDLENANKNINTDFSDEDLKDLQIEIENLKNQDNY
jgi:hypothetical protein